MQAGMKNFPLLGKPWRSGHRAGNARPYGPYWNHDKIRRGDRWSPAGPMKASAPTGCGKKSMEAGGQSCLPLHYKIEHGAENRRGGVKFLLVFYGKSGYNILYARSGMPRSRDPYLEEF